MFAPKPLCSLPPPSQAWTRFDDKLFENALMMFPEETPSRWFLIALRVPGKSPQEVFNHYLELIHDVGVIESGLVEPPVYKDEDGLMVAVLGSPQPSQIPAERGRGEERRRGVPWTENEHKAFLIGLQKYGRGDWRNISRWSVKTKTATQVASHAQKYFNRQESNSSSSSSNRESKRKSIHDITIP